MRDVTNLGDYVICNFMIRGAMATFTVIPWFQRFIFIIFIAKGRGKINLWNQGITVTVQANFAKSECK
jgi:hypothetical protein